jgi:hypothetical protein
MPKEQLGRGLPSAADVQGTPAAEASLHGALAAVGPAANGPATSSTGAPLEATSVAVLPAEWPA